jgi:VCBS repeat-containing protein
VDSNTATVSVTVTAVNDAPVCSPVTLTTAEDTPGQTNPSCTDVEGNPLTYSIVAQPTHGTASVAAGKLAYTPAANYNGADSFTYKANDGTVDSNTATVSVTVTAVNDAPVCSPVTLNTVENTPGQANPSCTDVDGNPLTYSIVTQPMHGIAYVVASKLSYTPTASYRGPDSFTYKANDGTVDSNTATISVIVIPIKDPPFIASINPFIVDAGSPDITIIIFGSNFGDITDTRVRLKGFDTLLTPLQVLSNGISIKITADQLAKPNIYILTVIKSTIHMIPIIPLTPYDQESNPVPFTVFGTRYIYIPIITKNTTH